MMSLTRLHEAFPIFRIEAASLLPAGWNDDIIECAWKHSEMRVLTGGSETSRQRWLGSADEFLVGVVQGKVVAKELLWLGDFYRGAVLELANSTDLGSFVCSNDVRSSVNINLLTPGNEYEWHVDSNPLTGLLFVTDHPAGSGGELAFRPDPVARPGEDWELVVQPRSGDLLLFDAREAAHHVRLLHGPSTRVTVPMNFYFADQGFTRPNDLDEYLYSN